MYEEIIINGETMDMDASFKGVQMVFQSPYLTDLKSIVSNRTNSVTFPATNHNRAIIGCASLQQASDFPYRKHTAIYKRDGVQMFNGMATLLSVTNKQIQMCFTWGNVDAFQKLFDTKMRDLADFYQGTTHRVEEYVPYGNAIYCPALIDCGTRKHQPAKFVKDIMLRIQQKCGISGLYNAFGMWNRLGLLLPTRIGDTTTKNLQRLKFGTSYPTDSKVMKEDYLRYLFIAPKTDTLVDYHNYYDSGEKLIYTNGAKKVRIYFDARIYFSYVGDSFYPSQFDGLRLFKMQDLSIDSTTGSSTLISLATIARQSGTGPYRTDFRVEAHTYYDVDIEGYSYIALALCGWDVQIAPNNDAFLIKYPYGQTDDGYITDISIVFDPDEAEEVKYGTGLAAYPIWANMPDMSCGDFVKAMMIPFGLFAYCLSDTQITFTSFADLYNNRVNARDWTDKMITLQPKERKTALDGYAQRNFLKYKEDEGVPVGTLDSEIDCDDETLNAEATLYESPFTLPYGNKVPIWSQEALSEEQFAGDERAPRLIGVAKKEIASTVHLMRYQSWLKWSALLYSYYQQYQRVVNKPVVIKADFLITTADLNALDMRIPVYLKQTGRYYAIRKLTTKNAKVAEAELIELK